MCVINYGTFLHRARPNNVCQSLFKHGKSSVELKLKTKTNNQLLYKIAVRESNISANFLIVSLKMLNG